MAMMRPMVATVSCRRGRSPARRSGGRRRSPSPGRSSSSRRRSPIMEMIHRFNDGILIVMTLIVVFVLALLVYRHGPLQRPRQSGPVEDQPQHADRGALDDRADPHPGRHRRAVLLASLRRARSGARHRRLRSGQDAADHQGDRQPVVLDLRISRQRRHLVRLAHAAGQRAHRSGEASRGFSPSTTRWSCRSASSSACR